MSAVHKIWHGGFTLIELMIAIVIFSITLSLGVSSYQRWVLNAQIRNAAESIQDGIQRARGEAVKCNGRAAFTLGALSAWMVTHVDACGTLAAGSVLESRFSSEGSKRATVAVTPVNTATITFGSLGTIVANTNGSATPTQFDISVPPSAVIPGMRPLRVAIGVAGQTRVCDPDPSITNKTPPDPRRCF